MGNISKAKSIEIAIESVLMRDDLTDQKKRDVVSLLNNVLGREWFVKWDDDSIIQALQDYKERNGRAPTVTNLSEPGMPKSLTIKTHFNMNASVFLKKLFPDEHIKRTERANRYPFETKEQWLNCFREQFDKHMDGLVGGRAYDANRDIGTPAWTTIASKCGVFTWIGLMDASGVKYKQCKTCGEPQQVYINSSTSKYIDLLNEQNDRREKLLKEIIDSL